MRESGRLKRVRGTPLPPWAFVAGRFGNAFMVSVLMVVLVTAIGRVLYDVPIPTETIPALLRDAARRHASRSARSASR